MSRRNLKDRNIRKLTRVGGTSLAVTLPVEFVKDLKWKERQKVVVRKVGQRIIIEDWPALTRRGKKKNFNNKKPPLKMR
jgi:antitoxin component of MazEF toxin-antitoxin module